MSRHRLLLSIYSLIFLLCCMQAQAQTGKRPNIILVVADDLGYGNLTTYNPKSKIPTPHIDQLAREGMQFSQFYAGSTVCAPSRCALMTGQDMGHAYIRGNSEQSLREQDVTLARQLQQNGYATGMFGKWGLGELGTAGEPQKKGFDAFFGYLNQRHAHHYFTDHLYELKNGRIEEVQTQKQYSHALIMEQAMAFLNANKDKPFFLYLPLTIPHAELLVTDTLMQPFLHADGSSKFGPETPFHQRDSSSYHSQQQPRAAFAAMITQLDQDMGRLQAYVKSLGLDDNTYIFFTSDNGPHQEGGADPEYFNSSGPLRGIKRDLYEGGIRVPFIVRAPGKVPAGSKNDQPWAFWDLLPTIGTLTQTPYPAGISGISFREVLSSGQPQREQHSSLYWGFNEGILKEALLQGDWKPLRFKEQGKPEILELYQLKQDIGEQHNVAAEHPGKVKALQRLMQQARTPAEHEAFDWSAMEE